MAIKDWKKVEEIKSGIVWKNRKNEKKFIILENATFYKRKVWILFINTADNDYRFKTKSAGLKYAKAYMRKN